MALKRYQETFGSVQTGGDVFVLAGASVEVRDETSGALAAIFEDRAGATPKANPFTTDSVGYGFFYAANGRYRITATLGGETVDLRDVGVGFVDFGDGTVSTLTGSQTLETALDDRSVVITSNLTVSIPTDYATLQAAIDDLCTRTVKQGVTITINIESGHALTAGLFIKDVDVSNFRITSTDATVLLAAGFSPANTGDGLAIQSTCVIGGNNSRLPLIDVLIDANLVGGVGVYIYNLSSAIIGGGKGVINADSYGLFVARGSKATAISSSFQGARYGSRVTTNSTLNCPSANFSGAVEASYAGSGTTACLDISRGSIVNAASTSSVRLNCSGGAARGIAVRRSYASVQANDVSNSGTEGLNIASGAYVYAEDTLANSCATDGIFCDSSQIYAANSTSTNSGRYNLFCNSGGFASVPSSDLSVAGGTRAVIATNGACIDVTSSNCRRVAGVNNTNDIAVLSASRIVASSATGGLSTTANTITADGYIIQ